ncbi:MAG TPA: HAMP domain-containing protein, partial [Vicinamibacteria bacterium]
MRVRTKLLVPFLVLPLGTLALLGGIAYRSGRVSIQASLGRLFELHALRAIEALDREVGGLRRGGDGWASLDTLQDVLTDDLDGRISSFLVAQARARAVLGRAVVADRAGRVVAASQPQWIGTIEPAPVATPDDLGECRDDPDPPSATERAGSTVTCSHPIRAHFDERQVIGSLSLSWDLVRLFATLRQEQNLSPDQGDLVLVRRDGLVVSAPPDRLDWLLRHNLVAAGSQAAVLAGAGRRGFLVEEIAGKNVLVGYAHSTGASGWSALVMQDAGAAFAPVRSLRDAVLGVGIAVALLALVLAPLASARLTRPMLELEAAAHRVADGDLDVRIEPRSSDEIGSLSRSFDRMVQELRRQRAELVDKDYVASLVAGMADGLFVVDESDVVRQANPAFRRLVGRMTEEVVGQPVASLFAAGA